MPPIQEDIHACTMCGYCVPVCPAYQEAGWEGASPRGRIFALRQYEMRGLLDLLLRRNVKPGEEFARNAWECTGCGACEEVCPVDIPFDNLWDDVKGGMVARPREGPTFRASRLAPRTGCGSPGRSPGTVRAPCVHVRTRPSTPSHRPTGCRMECRRDTLPRMRRTRCTPRRSARTLHPASRSAEGGGPAGRASHTGAGRKSDRA